MIPEIVMINKKPCGKRKTVAQNLVDNKSDQGYKIVCGNRGDYSNNDCDGERLVENTVEANLAATKKK